MKHPLKTVDQVRAEMRAAGMSLAEWARTHKVSYSLSHEVLSGRCKGHRGAAHDIAVLMGLKHGQLRRKARKAPQQAQAATA